MMMVVVVNVSLTSAASILSSGITGDSLVGDAAPDTKASARWQCTTAGRAGVARFVLLTVRRQILRSGAAARHALDRFHGGSHGLGIRLRPAKVAGEPLKKFFDLAVFDGSFDGLVLIGIRLGIGRIRIVCSHGNLNADIVGEFAR